MSDELKAILEKLPEQEEDIKKREKELEKWFDKDMEEWIKRTVRVIEVAGANTHDMELDLMQKQIESKQRFMFNMKTSYLRSEKQCE